MSLFISFVIINWSGEIKKKKDKRVFREAWMDIGENLFWWKLIKTVACAKSEQTRDGLLGMAFGARVIPSQIRETLAILIVLESALH